jgi:hypothetical protein
MLQEITLLIATFMCLFVRSPTILDTGALCNAEANPNYQPPSLSDTQCSLVAIVLHYLYTVHFVALFLEVRATTRLKGNIHYNLQSLHNYTVYTFVFVQRPMLSRRLLLPIALLAPLVIVVPTALFSFNKYVNTKTCWVDYSQINAIVEMAPNVIFALSAVIIAEATSMRKFKEHPDANEQLREAAVANARAAVFISFASIGAFVFRYHSQ